MNQGAVRARRARPSTPRRLGAAAGLLFLLAGGPLALLALAGPPAIPERLPGLGEVTRLLGADHVGSDALIGILGLLGWAIWAYLAGAVLLRAWAHVAARQGAGRGAGLLRASDAITPAFLRTLVDGALAVVLLAGSTRVPVEAGASPPRVAVAEGACHPIPAAYEASGPHRHGVRAYRVQPGDTLWGIAERFLGDGQRYPELFRANAGRRMAGGGRLVDPNLIRPGWELEIPGVSEHDGHYRVRPGDSLWRIAERELGDPFRWREIYELNRGRVMEDGERLVDPALIRPGWVLELPAREGTREEGHQGRGEAGQQDAPPAPESSPKPSPGGESSPSLPSRTGEPGVSPRPAPEPVVRLPEGWVIPASLAGALLAAASLVVRRRRARRLDFFAEAGAVPSPAESFLPLLRQRLRGVEVDRVSVLADRLGRTWEELGNGAMDLRGLIEGPDWVSFLLGMEWEEALKATGPRLAESMGCTVRAEALGPGVVALTLSGPAAGAVSFLPGARPRFPLLVPLGVLGSSVLHLNLATVPLALAGEEAADLSLSLILAAAARTSPLYLRVALPEEDPELAPARRLPHAGFCVSGLDREVTERRQLFEDEGARDFEEHVRRDPDVILPRILAVLGEEDARPFADAAHLGIHVLRLGPASSEGPSVTAREGEVVLDPGTAAQLGLGDRELTLETVRLGPEQVGACVELLSEAFESPSEDELPPLGPSGEPPVGALAPEEPAASPQEQDRGDEVRTSEAPVLADEVVPRPVEIRCLGAFRVVSGGREVSRGRTKSFELLARLALRRGEWVGKERIAEDLWPEMDPEAQDERLWKAATGLRTLLRSGSGDDREIVQRERGAYRLDPEHVRVDLWEFEEAVEAARVGAGGIETLRRAAACYRGDLFEDRYYDWAEAERRRLRDRYLGVLLLLTEGLVEEGDLAGALDAVHRGLALEPLSEAFHGWAMRIYAAQDRRDAVAAQYRELERRLEAEGLEPSEEVTRLLSELTARGRMAEEAVG